MRSLLFLSVIIGVVGLAVWAYQENYQTQDATAKSEELRQNIQRSQERLRVLRAEWAYLNRPDRLRDLVELNYDSLELLPMQADQFGTVDQVPYPRDETQLILEGVDLSAPQSASEEVSQ